MFVNIIIIYKANIIKIIIKGMFVSNAFITETEIEKDKINNSDYDDFDE